MKVVYSIVFGTLMMVSALQAAALRLAPILNLSPLPSGSDSHQRKYMVTYLRRCADRVEGLFTTHLGASSGLVLGVAVRNAPADKCTTRDSVETLPLTLPAGESAERIEFVQPEDRKSRSR